MSADDALITKKVAFVIAGGDATPGCRRGKGAFRETRLEDLLTQILQLPDHRRDGGRRPRP